MGSQQVALITGGAKRIGQAIALSLAKQGYHIALHYDRSGDEAQKTAQAIRRLGVACHTFKSDLVNDRQTAALIPAVLKKFKRLNVLVNNASIFGKAKLKSGNSKELDRNWAINFKAPYILTSCFARKCRRGSIINILDTNIVKNKTTHVPYLLSKKALGALTELAAVELAPNIRVNGIAPGLILPPPGEKTGYLTRLANNIPLKKKGSVENITQTVEFLLTNDFLTGEIIFVDGGEHL